MHVMPSIVSQIYLYFTDLTYLSQIYLIRSAQLMRFTFNNLDLIFLPLHCQCAMHQNDYITQQICCNTFRIWKNVDTPGQTQHYWGILLGVVQPCYCPACRTTLIARRFRVAVICPIIQVPHFIRVFFYFVWFVFINHIFQFYYELCTYCNILDIYLS